MSTVTLRCTSWVLVGLVSYGVFFGILAITLGPWGTGRAFASAVLGAIVSHALLLSPITPFQSERTLYRQAAQTQQAPT